MRDQFLYIRLRTLIYKNNLSLKEIIYIFSVLEHIFKIRCGSSWNRCDSRAQQNHHLDYTKRAGLRIPFSRLAHITPINIAAGLAKTINYIPPLYLIPLSFALRVCNRYAVQFLPLVATENSSSNLSVSYSPLCIPAML